MKLLKILLACLLVVSVAYAGSSGALSGDLSGYVPVTQNGNTFIETTGNGTDITLQAKDDVFLIGGAGIGPRVEARNDASWVKSADQVSYVKVQDSGVTLTTDGTLSLAGTFGVLLSTGAAPSAANDACTQNAIAINTTHIFVCVAPNTWKRVAIATWP